MIRFETKFPTLTLALLAATATACTGDDSDDPIPAMDDDGDTDTNVDPDDAELPDPEMFQYTAEHVFTMDDILGGPDGVRAGEDRSIICTKGCEDLVREDDGVTLYPIDNAWGYDAIDYNGATERPRDGVYADGYVGALEDENGEHQGIAIANVPTTVYRVGSMLGQWCGGFGGELVKCKSDHYVTLEHVLTCHESVPYMYYDPNTGEPSTSDFGACTPLDDELDMDPWALTEYQFDLDEDNMAQGEDYAIILGEHVGEYKYIFGDHEKRPTDVRLLATIELPAEWKQSGRVFEVTRAELAIVHTITNNPNDKITPEDVDNEGATGRLPGYEVNDAGQWISTRDCYEGDGDFIPAGTVLRNPDFAQPDALTEDLQLGFTNAWYTTLDREPFEWTDTSGPRWRLIAGKYGQDLPGVDIADTDILVDPCTPQPIKKGDIKYARGELTTTLIDLLDPLDGETSPFTTSTGWIAPNGEQTIVDDNLTANGIVLTQDLDLGLRIKGDQQPVRLYKAVLYLDYEEVL